MHLGNLSFGDGSDICGREFERIAEVGIDAGQGIAGRSRVNADLLARNLR